MAWLTGAPLKSLCGRTGALCGHDVREHFASTTTTTSDLARLSWSWRLSSQAYDEWIYVCKTHSGSSRSFVCIACYVRHNRDMESVIEKAQSYVLKRKPYYILQSSQQAATRFVHRNTAMQPHAAAFKARTPREPGCPTNKQVRLWLFVRLFGPIRGQCLFVYEVILLAAACLRVYEYMRSWHQKRCCF
jgi:hypothetical protein